MQGVQHLRPPPGGAAGCSYGGEDGKLGRGEGEDLDSAEHGRMGGKPGAAYDIAAATAVAAEALRRASLAQAAAAAAVDAAGSGSSRLIAAAHPPRTPDAGSTQGVAALWAAATQGAAPWPPAGSAQGRSSGSGTLSSTTTADHLQPDEQAMMLMGSSGALAAGSGVSVGVHSPRCVSCLGSAGPGGSRGLRAAAGAQLGGREGGAGGLRRRHGSVPSLLACLTEGACAAGLGLSRSLSRSGPCSARARALAEDPLLSWVSSQLQRSSSSGRGSPMHGSGGSAAAGGTAAGALPPLAPRPSAAASFGAAAATPGTLSAAPSGGRSASWRRLDSGLVDLTPWLINYADLDLQRPLGEGSFGKVRGVGGGRECVCVCVCVPGARVAVRRAKQEGKHVVQAAMH